MMVGDLALLLPPLARFFVGILLILIVVGVAYGFTAFLFNLYGEDE